MSEAIPSPRGLPFIGNLLDLQDEVPIRAIERLADIYGPLFKISAAGQSRIFASSFDLCDELCDETRFWKVPPRALQNPDPNAATGLFTAPSEKSEDWGQAHRILMPAFGPLAIQGMFDGECSLPVASIFCIHRPLALTYVQRCTILQANLS
jgi:cytochrome P450 / NADPH-cytochrome P450 reductase